MLQSAKNETENEANFEHKIRELRHDSEVKRNDGKKPLTRLATLATLSPGKRAVDEVYSGTEATREIRKSWERS